MEHQLRFEMSVRSYREYPTSVAFANDCKVNALILRDNQSPRNTTTRSKSNTTALDELETKITSLETTTQDLILDLHTTTTVLSSSMLHLFEELKKI